MKRITAFLSIVFCLSAYASNVNLQGKVTKEGGSDGIAGARVTLKHHPSIVGVSGSDGAFTLTGNTKALVNASINANAGIAIRSLKNGVGIVLKTATRQSKAKIDIYNTNGRLVASKRFVDIAAGEYVVPFSGAAAEAYIVKVVLDNTTRMFKTVPGMGMACDAMSGKGMPTAQSAGLRKAASAVSDSVVVVAQGYKNALSAIQTYEKTDLAVSLAVSNPWIPTSAPQDSNGMVKIKAKDYNFEMGQPNNAIWPASAIFSSSEEQPVHTVSFLHDFWLDTTEVRQAQFDSLMKKTYSNYVTPQWNARFGLGPDYPASLVNWANAVLFCNARSKSEGLTDTVYSYTMSGTPGTTACDLTQVTVNASSKAYRLPTEAEWEYACKGGTFTDYYWGKNFSDYATATVFTQVDSFAIWTKNSQDYGTGNPGYGFHVIASKLPNKYGLYDMIGNLSEWCHDDYLDYSWGAVTDSVTQIKTKFHAERGGHWATGISYLRSACRAFDNAADYYTFFWGFRVARTAED
jgi:formylglycine-generating enzyme required for sulfatase activity